MYQKKETISTKNNGLEERNDHHHGQQIKRTQLSPRIIDEKKETTMTKTSASKEGNDHH